MKFLKRKFIGIYTAAKAGWIASRCPLCIIDDEEEEIRACYKHQKEIGELQKKNEETW